MQILPLRAFWKKRRHPFSFQRGKTPRSGLKTYNLELFIINNLQ